MSDGKDELGNVYNITYVIARNSYDSFCENEGVLKMKVVRSCIPFAGIGFKAGTARYFAEFIDREEKHWNNCEDFRARVTVKNYYADQNENADVVDITALPQLAIDYWEWALHNLRKYNTLTFEIIYPNGKYKVLFSIKNIYKDKYVYNYGYATHQGEYK